jgi:hypothetical protein
LPTTANNTFLLPSPELLDKSWIWRGNIMWAEMVLDEFRFTFKCVTGFIGFSEPWPDHPAPSVSFDSHRIWRWKVLGTSSIRNLRSYSSLDQNLTRIYALVLTVK